MKFAKGHGTQNDFVVLPDVPAHLDLTPGAVTALCDRRRGIGADGVLRVTRAGAALGAGTITRLPDGVSVDDWFMDYRNADGSIAQMCGNGVRVFAHYLRVGGFEDREEFVVGTLAGPRPVVVHHADDSTADITVGMGGVTVTGRSVATIGGSEFAGLVVDVGNPHLACLVPGLTTEELQALDIGAPVSFDRSVFPGGVNVEVLTPPSPGPGVDATVSMRVHERGVGETRSCGTGTVAAAVAALAHQGRSIGVVAVRVPGGEVRVRIAEANSYLRGPSVLVAHGDIDDSWWAAQF